MAACLPVKLLAVALLGALTATGCAGAVAPTSPTPSPVVSDPTPAISSGSPSETAPECGIDGASGEHVPLGTCRASFINFDQPSPPYAQYVIPGAGWLPFNGTYKDVATDAGVQRVGALFVTITNLTDDACLPQLALDPAIGPTVDDLAEALTRLPPFEVSIPPTDVSAFGYAGKHLEIRVPLDQPSSGFEIFTGCGRHLLKSWISPGHVSSAFNGYTAPGDTEDFWIIDVNGTRAVVEALTSANASAELVAERQAILDSVVIIP